MNDPNLCVAHVLCCTLSPSEGWALAGQTSVKMQSLALLVITLVLGTGKCGVLEDQRILHGRPLSDKPRDGDEDYDYDHDAFLGGEDAEYFDSLDPEESRRRLGVIYDQIDKDMNGLINLEELQKWIQFVQEREVREDTERQWGERNKGCRALQY